MNRKCESKHQPRFYFCEKIFTRKMVIPRTWIRKKWYSTHDSKPQGEWDRVAELMMIKFGESGYPVFRATSPLSRGTLQSKGGGKLSTHFCADGDTIETVFPHVMSGIICCACSISAISVLQFVLKQWRKDFNKMQEKNESQQNLHQ